MTKFKHGDIIIGNDLANKNYGITRKGTKWVVINPVAGGMNTRITICSVQRFNAASDKEKEDVNCYRLEEFTVGEASFDFVGVAYYKPNKDKAYVLERFDD